MIAMLDFCMSTLCITRGCHALLVNVHSHLHCITSYQKVVIAISNNMVESNKNSHELSFVVGNECRCLPWFLDKASGPNSSTYVR